MTAPRSRPAGGIDITVQPLRLRDRWIVGYQTAPGLRRMGGAQVAHSFEAESGVVDGGDVGVQVGHGDAPIAVQTGDLCFQTPAAPTVIRRKRTDIVGIFPAPPRQSSFHRHVIDQGIPTYVGRATPHLNDRLAWLSSVGVDQDRRSADGTLESQDQTFDSPRPDAALDVGVGDGLQQPALPRLVVQGVLQLVAGERPSEELLAQDNYAILHPLDAFTLSHALTVSDVAGPEIALSR